MYYNKDKKKEKIEKCTHAMAEPIPATGPNGSRSYEMLCAWTFKRHRDARTDVGWAKQERRLALSRGPTRYALLRVALQGSLAA